MKTRDSRPWQMWPDRPWPKESQRARGGCTLSRAPRSTSGVATHMMWLLMPTTDSTSLGCTLSTVQRHCNCPALGKGRGCLGGTYLPWLACCLAEEIGRDWARGLWTQPGACELNPRLGKQNEDETEAWTSSLNPHLAQQPPFPVKTSNVLWQGTIYHQDILYGFLFPYPVSPTYFRSNWDISYRGAFNLDDTFLMLNLVPKCHKQSHRSRISTCHRAFIVLGTSQSCFFQLIL